MQTQDALQGLLNCRAEFSLVLLTCHITEWYGQHFTHEHKRIVQAVTSPNYYFLLLTGLVSMAQLSGGNSARPKPFIFRALLPRRVQQPLGPIALNLSLKFLMANGTLIQQKYKLNRKKETRESRKLRKLPTWNSPPVASRVLSCVRSNIFRLIWGHLLGQIKRDVSRRIKQRNKIHRCPNAPSLLVYRSSCTIRQVLGRLGAGEKSFRYGS